MLILARVGYVSDGPAHREEPTINTPETVITPDLPPAAWITIEPPNGDTFVLASTEAAAARGRSHLLEAPGHE